MAADISTKNQLAISSNHTSPDESISIVVTLLTDIGFDKIKLFQITCDGIKPEELKREYRKHITFWCESCDTR